MSLNQNTARAASSALAGAGEPDHGKQAPKVGVFQRRKGATQENPAVNVILTIVLSLGAVIMAAPLVWMVSTSLKTKDGVYSLPPEWIPDPFVWDNYVRVFQDTYVLSGIKNSLIVALSVTIVGTVFSSLAAFALAKLRLPGKNVIFIALLSGMMVPFPTLMIPQFIMFSRIGWVDTLLPLIVPVILGNVIMIFFLRQYLHNVPDSLVEAAKIDGASYLKIFWTMILPLMRPAIAAQFILWFMAVWNDYLAPIIYLNSPEKQTLQVVIANMNVQYATQRDYPLIMTASVISVIPILIVFLIFQRQIIESIALTGSKT
ncbi:carbohydrate ABC transporter permease [Demequina sp. SYSU T00192]|uniref:Carbohydrate ABC transporter permease n=1 Tax=Demequina litoralis TaxID=3051660 RepID=A0ABT8G8E9_9MICO|nr:carbohydrate ABC transporter permease [Demequina sp. SYSU T00192]MDN4475267.1 carbohydrate ABC transporter permease [Demequina sp. SYSU T00192]